MLDLNPDYILVQISYAKRWQRLGILSFEEALTEKTCIYKLLFGASPKNGALALEWKAVAKELDRADPLFGAAIVMQLIKSGLLPPPAKSGRHYSRYFGPFRYSYDSEKKEVSIHFSVKEGREGVLHWREGKEDLRALFQEVKKKLPEAMKLKVESTLMFNDFWKKMCPPELFENFIEARDENSILMRETPWSQFIDFRGRPKKEMVEQFLSRVESAKNGEELVEAFPIMPRRSFLMLDVCYRFYGL